MKKRIILYLFVCFCIVIIGTLFLKRNNNNGIKPKLQIIRIYTFEDKEEIIKEIDITRSQMITLDDIIDIGHANNIKIVEIADKFVRISREAVRYSNSKKRIETIYENIEYNKAFDIDIDESDPNITKPATAPKYYYNLKFVK